MGFAEFIKESNNKIRFTGEKSEAVRHIRRLQSGTVKNPDNLIVLDGLWAHKRALQAGLRLKTVVFCLEMIKSEEAENICMQAIVNCEEIYAVSPRVYEKMCERDRGSGIISVAVLPLHTPETLRIPDNGVVFVLDGLEKPGNIGTILRSCDGAGIDAVLICDRLARMWHPKMIKGSMGAVFFVPVALFETAEMCRDWLKNRGFGIYLTDTRAQNGYGEFDYRGATAVVFGSERYGIPPVWYGDAHLLSIPMLGVCDSLNVGVAASVVAYEILKKRSNRKNSLST